MWLNDCDPESSHYEEIILKTVADAGDHYQLIYKNTEFSPISILVFAGQIDTTFYCNDGSTPLPKFTTPGYDQLLNDYDGTKITSLVDAGNFIAFDPFTCSIGTTSDGLILVPTNLSDVILFVNGKEIILKPGESYTHEDSPKDQKSSILEMLIALKDSTDTKTDKKIDKAIKHLEKSIDDKFWTDDGDLIDDKKSKKIFDKEKKSVKTLMKIIKKGNSGIDSELTDIILLLVGIDRDLALNAINLVSDEVQDKDKKQLDKAEKALEKGDKQTSKGKYDKAIDKYKKAWKHAQKTVKQINH
ncbi:MAG: hypothetical protein HRO68_04320 [Nitrosopumilus sp.]|nr:hypothetical protein [Nitrosopumilus sp.]